MTTEQDVLKVFSNLRELQAFAQHVRLNDAFKRLGIQARYKSLFRGVELAGERKVHSLFVRQLEKAYRNPELWGGKTSIRRVEELARRASPIWATFNVPDLVQFSPHFHRTACPLSPLFVAIGNGSWDHLIEEESGYVRYSAIAAFILHRDYGKASVEEIKAALGPWQNARGNTVQLRGVDIVSNFFNYHGGWTAGAEALTLIVKALSVRIMLELRGFVKEICQEEVTARNSAWKQCPIGFVASSLNAFATRAEERIDQKNGEQQETPND